MSFLEADDSPSSPPKSAEAKVPASAYSDESMKDWLFEKTDEQDKFVCLILGGDGTAKSPLALSYMTDEDIKDGKRVVVVDLDAGNVPLINKYHKERCKSLGREANDVFLVKNPLTHITTKEGIEIDYKATFNKTQGIVKLLQDKKFREEYKIKYIIFDGLSTALKMAENQMRVEKNIDATGGVMLKFWLIRNKLFTEMVEAMKSLPISSFFIAHEDFILKTGEENSSVKIKMNAMVHQKIHMVKKKIGDETIFRATITKSKYNVLKEGHVIDFGKVNTKTGKCVFEPEKVLEGLV